MPNHHAPWYKIKSPAVKILLAVAVFIILAAALERSSCIWLSVGILASATLIALIKVVAIGCQWLRGMRTRVSGRQRNLKFLASIMVLFLFTGALLYLRAFYWIGIEAKGQINFVNSEYLLRSLVGSLDLFMLDIDSNIVDKIAGHPRLKGAISLQAVLSFGCTVSLLIGLFYSRLLAYYKLSRLPRALRSGRSHLYVFFGMNEPSETLAKSISASDDRSVVVFVEQAQADDDDTQGWDSIVRLFAHRKKAFLEADDLNAYITITDTHLSEIEQPERNGGDILGNMNLPQLKKTISRLQKLPESQLHVLFLSEDEDDNLRCAATLTYDDTIAQAVRSKSDNVRFYCHARRNGINRSLEDLALRRDINVQLVDYSRLAIDSLRDKPENQPVRLMDVDLSDHPTAVTSPFHALVVGFNWCGQDALSYLYEFGAFLDGPTRRRSYFHCTVVDKDMDTISGAYRALHPQACRNVNAPRATGMPTKPLIDFVQADFRSTDFYDKVLAPLRKEINYVVIAVGDDDAGINLAINIFSYINRYRADLSRLRICVRCYNREKENFMQKIADHYNNCRQAAEPVIVLFGQAQAIYSYDMIVDQSIQERAKLYFARYAEFKDEDVRNWDTRRRRLLGQEDKKGKEIPVDQRRLLLANIRSLRRKENQDINNVLHAATKLYLLQLAVPSDGRDSFLSRYFDSANKPRTSGSKARIRYDGLSDAENAIVRNLAMLEHIRWNASHEMLGYESTEPENEIHSCDETLRRHNCLRDWDKLDAESDIVTRTSYPCDYKGYDYGVVDTTLDLYRQRFTEQ